MNVLYVTHSDDKYGAARSLQALFKNITKYDVRPVVLTLRRNRYNEIADAAGIRNYVVPYLSCTAGSGGSKFKLFAKKIRYLMVNAIAQMKVLRIVDRENIDIIHINTSIIDIGLLARAKRDIHLVWHIREFMDLDYNKIYLNRSQIKWMNRYCDRFVFISHAIKRYWEEKGITEKGVVVYNGIDPDKFSFSAPAPAQNRIEIAFVGSISRNKGQYQLIDAVIGMPQEYRNRLHVNFYGKGPESYENELKKRIADAKMDDLFTFAGFTENISEELSKCSIGVVASKAEGFGRVTVEYMMSGVFVIASSSGANRELIDDRKTGMLFEYGNASDLGEKLCWALDHKEEVAAMTGSARKTARERFSEETYVSQIYNVYKGLFS